MTLSGFIRSPYCSIGLGMSALMAAGLWIWSAAEEQDEMPEKHFLNLPTVDGFKEDRCFSKFFPHATPHNERGFDSMEIGTDEEISRAKENVSFPGLDSNSHVEGCIGANLSHDLQDSLWDLHLGLAFRNEKVGVAFYADGAGRNTSSPESKYGQLLNYSLFLMKHENSIWRIKAGYFWRDNGIVGNDLKLYFRGVHGSNWMDINEEGDNSKKSGSVFSITWDGVRDESGVANLGQFTLQGTKEGKSLILGRVGSFKERISDNRLYLSRIYGVDKSTWFDHKDSSFDLGGVLDSWLAPFMNTKIKWFANGSGCAWNSRTGAECSNEF